MEIACTPDKAETLRNFFENHNVQVYDNQINPCIDPTIAKGNERDSRKLQNDSEITSSDSC